MKKRKAKALPDVPVPRIGEWDADVLGVMRDRARGREGVRWAAYRNVALDSADCGRIQALMVGPGCTYTVRPDRMPDTQVGLGWKYRFEGFVNLDDGSIEPA